LTARRRGWDLFGDNRDVDPMAARFSLGEVQSRRAFELSLSDPGGELSCSPLEVERRRCKVLCCHKAKLIGARATGINIR